ncbi:MAG: alkaline phosphatase D family protein [Deltaproteobacteria bacterium]|nr:alkaline phosphatase D family protein [Deltaproteobacteria bacterium]MBW2719012.1 alkaline phosphatase D family protein [Deltaproteobacteria bacterium]
MNFSRRDILKGMGAAGLTPLIAAGCDSSSDGSGGTGGSPLPPLPELPEYEWDGPIGPENLFEHGVASGDPLSDGVILWTRVTPEVAEPVEVWWEMALDEDFLERTAQGTLTTDASRDFTAKVDVPGLVWGRNYFYRFAVQGRWSATGRTRLAPKSDEVSKLRFGVCSCANYGFGYFHGFRHLAARADLDAILHLGDYFYEYGNGTFPTEEEQLRMLEPPHETVTLEDYRMRFSLYRRDADLQECHRQHPFIVVWDDHETANNSWMGGAQNHDPETEGSWPDRVAAARQAFFEWIPIRDNTGQQLYRTLKYGDLADIIMLDTRIEGREEQFPLLVFPADEPSLPANLISAEQETWLQDQLFDSTAKWKILGNQVVMSLWQFVNPDGSKTNANSDQWNGYREGRERLMTFLRENDILNTVVITGDVHSSWAMDVTFGDGSYNPETREGALGVEFVASGITSPPEIPQQILDAFISQSAHIRYAEAAHRGYFVLDLQAEKAQADWYLLDGIGENDGAEMLDASWAALDGENHVTEMSSPETPNDDAPNAAS